MAKNENLHKASKAKKDEFYTQLADIERELHHYKDFFRDKTVFCNCDDPFESNFVKYFSMNFNILGIKKLIATCYVSSPIVYTQLTLENTETATPDSTGKKPYKIEITEVTDENGDGRIDLTDVEYLLRNRKNALTLLKGDGDFRSPECVELLKQADVVVTNPPFSLFREYVAQLIEHGKKFIIIGPQNAITYKEIFPLIMQNKMWLGHGFHKSDAYFRVPPENASNYAPGVYNPDTGLVHFRNCTWFTNVDHAKRHEDLILFRQYMPEEYPQYDNYDAINVDKVADIPCDYFEDMGVPITFLDKYNPGQNDEKDLTTQSTQPPHTHTHTHTHGLRLTSESSGANCNGIMGVPITFLDKFNPDQFEIVGATESEGKGFSNGLWDAGSGVAQALVGGNRKFKRIFIKRKL